MSNPAPPPVPPVSVAGGGADCVPQYFAFPAETTSLGPAAGYAIGAPAYSSWLDSNDVRVVGAGAARFTVRALHEGTVIIQGMRLTDVRCTAPTDGTLVLPGPIGGPGEEVEKTVLAFDLAERSPRARTLLPGDTGSHFALGDPYFSKSIYLEGGAAGDARTFEVYFVAGSQDCEFGLDVKVTSNDKESWVPAEPAEGVQRSRVAAFATAYRSIVAPTGPEDGWVGQKPVPVGTSVPGLTVTSPARN
ncbi:hypothetical protein [Kitasatospora sp. CB01950]|uniref:hypothetical protein n=1 Tax=Kitasatospora sp. CB01950 TaxID=1703930 RepID=UPI00093BF2D9|nr:hypothetical protein [Kitasatospora sp. CB01950]OKJ05627.1 hypothetical protein AMK19_25360 [Kitasatospora sp. CB01950]